MIVVDVGCMTQGPEHSTDVLIERFSPTVYFGFDPHPDQPDIVTRDSSGAPLVFRRAAAWTHSGKVVVGVDGIKTGVEKESGLIGANEVIVDAVDLPEFIYALPAYPDVVLKLDCEGSEYPLLAEIARRGLDARLALVLVEWHPRWASHGMFVEEADRPVLRCPVELWG